MAQLHAHLVVAIAILSAGSCTGVTTCSSAGFEDSEADYGAFDYDGQQDCGAEGPHGGYAAAVAQVESEGEAQLMQSQFSLLQQSFMIRADAVTEPEDSRNMHAEWEHRKLPGNSGVLQIDARATTSPVEGSLVSESMESQKPPRAGIQVFEKRAPSTKTMPRTRIGEARPAKISSEPRASEQGGTAQVASKVQEGMPEFDVVADAVAGRGHMVPHAFGRAASAAMRVSRSLGIGHRLPRLQVLKMQGNGTALHHPQKCGSLAPLELRLQLELLQILGMYPQRTVCHPSAMKKALEEIFLSPPKAVQPAPHSLMQAEAVVLPLQPGVPAGIVPWGPTAAVLVVCFLIYLGIILLMASPILLPRITGARPSKATQNNQKQQPKHEGWLSWLSMGLVDHLIANPVSLEAVPQLGRQADLSYFSALEFEKVWAQEVAERGLTGASILRVLLRFVGVNHLASLLFTFALRGTLQNIISILLVDVSLGYIHWLHFAYATNMAVPGNLVAPILLSVMAFSGIPLGTMLISTIATHHVREVNQRLSGALQLAVHRKAQRLPACARPSEPQVDSLQLTQAVCACTVSVLTIVGLLVIIWMHMTIAVCVSLLTALPLVCLVLACMCFAHSYLGTLQERSDQRRGLLKELLSTIRMVKSYAWESIAESRVTRVREEELGALKSYCGYLGCLVGAAVQMPSLLLLSALAGHCYLYGAADVEVVFVCLQVLSVLRNTVHQLAASSAQLVAARPPLRRLENFLKEPEAPRLPGRVPDWVEMWPERSGVLRIQGNFAWNAGGTIALHNLSLEVPQGKLVAVVGEVGAGKSALLLAALGELFPARPGGRVSVPKRIAYCPQVSCLNEGSVKDNVILGEACDEERFTEAISGAGLAHDLEVMGGQSTPLSEGQRAKVAMARAAYVRGTSLVLVDDPFSAVDARTSTSFMETLLMGPLMRNRTRIVVLQPEPERLALFDRVVVLAAGQIKEQGPPAEVMRTEAFRRLLSASPTGPTDSGKAPRSASGVRSTRQGTDVDASKQQPDMQENVEVEGRIGWPIVADYCRRGGWLTLFLIMVLLLIQSVTMLLADLALVHWTNARAVGEGGKVTSDNVFLLDSCIWFVVSTVVWGLLVLAGQRFTLRVSRTLHSNVLRRLLQAPVDEFFGRTPAGRILGRLCTDMQAVDLRTFIRFVGAAASLYRLLLPLVFIHVVTHPLLLIGAAPLYSLAGALLSSYWGTMVQLRQLASNCRSNIHSYAAGMMQNSAVLRAYQETDRTTLELSRLVDEQVRADLTGGLLLKQWIVTRLLMLWSFFVTCVALVSIWSPHLVGPGTLGLCLTNCMLIMNGLESNIETCADAQFEFIALGRLQEYLKLPQEQPQSVPGEGRFRGFVVTVRRHMLGMLFYDFGPGGRLQVGRRGNDVPLLEGTLDGSGLTAPSSAPGTSLWDVCPSCVQLQGADAWHCVIAVNNVYRNAEDMAQELCSGTSDEVWMEIQSGWLVDGARVSIEGLKAGYAGVSRDVLRGISVEFCARQRIGIVGPTGCGKSALLLALLRVLEPRRGRVLLNGVDTHHVGLKTLRLAVGLVPQSPVMFSGSLRDNIDLLHMYPDSRVWLALQRVQLASYARSLPAGLHSRLKEGGDGLSFGQRQLLSLARAVLRQPALMLLDEATSAVDWHTHEAVQAAVREAFPRSTILAVAHRLETVLDFHQVIVMDRGDIVEKGDVKDLMRIPNGTLARALTRKSAS